METLQYTLYTGTAGAFISQAGMTPNKSGFILYVLAPCYRILMEEMHQDDRLVGHMKEEGTDCCLIQIRRFDFSGRYFVRAFAINGLFRRALKL